MDCRFRTLCWRATAGTALLRRQCSVTCRAGRNWTACVFAGDRGCNRRAARRRWKEENRFYLMAVKGRRNPAMGAALVAASKDGRYKGAGRGEHNQEERLTDTRSEEERSGARRFPDAWRRVGASYEVPQRRQSRPIRPARRPRLGAYQGGALSVQGILAGSMQPQWSTAHCCQPALASAPGRLAVRQIDRCVQWIDFRLVIVDDHPMTGPRLDRENRLPRRRFEYVQRPAKRTTERTMASSTEGAKKPAFRRRLWPQIQSVTPMFSWPPSLTTCAEGR